MIGRPVAITGIGVVSPLGVGKEAFETAVREGRSAMVAIERFATTRRRSHTGALVREFEPEQFVHPNRLRRMDSLSVQAVVAARLAIDDAGLGEVRRELPSPTMGVSFGTGYGCQSTTLRYAQKLVHQGGFFTNPIDFPDSIDGAPAAHIAMELGLQGPSTTTVDGGLSGETAVWHAAHAIRSGRAERMLAGGGDQVTELLHRVLDELGVWCAADASGQELMCPYDERHRGALPGEATAMLLLEAPDAAARRGARVYAQLLGSGQAVAPGCSPVAYPAGPAAFCASMRGALEAAGVAGHKVDLCSGAAASMPGVDGVELQAADEVFGAGDCSLVAYKSATGEFEAAGALRLAALALAVSEGFLPPTLNLERPVRPTRLSFSAEPRRSRLRYALHHGFARGGHSVSLLLGSP